MNPTGKGVRAGRQRPFGFLKAPLVYLGAQALCVGFTLALLFTVGNTTFIVANGADRLPIAYLWIGLVTPLLSIGYNRLQRVWSVSRMGMGTVALFTSLHLLAWWFAESTRLTIAAYLLFIGYSLAFSFLLIVLNTQANRLFTHKQMKTQYPLMLAIQTVAVILGGIVVAPLSRWLGGEVALILVGAGSMVLLMVCVALTSRQFPQLRQPPLQDEDKPVSIKQLSSQRLPRLLTIYQLLSWLGTLLIIYLFTVMAGRVFSSAGSLNQFFGNLIAGATLGTLLFLIFAAGRILQRYGVGIGLLLNPALVIVFVLAALMSNLLVPGQILLLLGLTTTARALDHILSIGTTGSSVNAFIKQLPENTQLSLLTVISAFAVPLAYGITGGIVLLVQFWSDASLTPILVITLVICLLWTWAALRLYPEAA